VVKLATRIASVSRVAGGGVLRLIDCPREADKQLHAVDRQFDNNIGMGSDSLRSTLLTEEACESLDQD
jgi:hypothetical protein